MNGMRRRKRKAECWYRLSCYGSERDLIHIHIYVYICTYTHTDSNTTTNRIVGDANCSFLNDERKEKTFIKETLVADIFKAKNFSFAMSYPTAISEVSVMAALVLSASFPVSCRP